ncbi:MAG: DUF1003 domain-containing protein [Actinomycetota bacterium]|nr:DUF1003 domain-containing protein [Actinomycetota bacterium]
MKRWTIGTGRWRHPAVPTAEHLSLGERAADRLRNGMGSWPFVFASLGFLAGWMLANGRHGFDPYPFILLNLILSCLAALQGAILLIAAKRADAIASALAQHDYETDLDTERRLHAVYTLVEEIHQANLRPTERSGTATRAGRTRPGRPADPPVT